MVPPWRLDCTSVQHQGEELARPFVLFLEQLQRVHSSSPCVVVGEAVESSEGSFWEARSLTAGPLSTLPVGL
jgi:hypothetical protein